MNTLGERLNKVIILKGLNANKLSVITGIHASTIKNYIDNKGKPDPIKLDKIIDVLNINKDWLLNGKGDMIKNQENFTLEEVNNSKDILSKIQNLIEIIKYKDDQINTLKEQVNLLKEKNNLLLLLNENVDINDKTKISFLEKQNQILTQDILMKLTDIPIKEIKEIHELITRSVLLKKIEEGKNKIGGK